MNKLFAFRCGGGPREAEQEEEECGDTPAGRLTQSLLMQTVPQRISTGRRRQDTREYRWVSLGPPVMCGAILMLVVAPIHKFLKL